MPDPSPSTSARRLELLRRLRQRGVGLLVFFSAIGVALIVIPIIALLMSRTEPLQELTDEIDPVAIRLARAQVDIVRLMNDAARLSLAVEVDLDAYEQSRLRYTASRTLLNSVARDTRYEPEVRDLLVLMDHAASIADEGIEAALAGDPWAMEIHLTGRGAEAVNEVSRSVASLRERLDAASADAHGRNVRRERIELAIGVGASLLGAVAVLSLVAIEQSRRRLTYESERDRARFAGMVEATGFGVIELDQLGRIGYVNPAAAELLGWEVAELAGRNESSFLPPPVSPDTGASEPSPLREALARGEPYAGEETFVRGDGETLTVEVSCGLCELADDDGSVQRRPVVLVFQDLSDRIAREQQQAEFLAVASHELRTPLTSVVGFSRRLVQGMERGRISADDDAREEVETLNREAERMRDMVSVFLDMSRLDANALEIELGPLEVTDVVDEEVERLRQRHPDARVHVEYPAEEAVVESDEHRVRQVVANLLDNAWKYGGTPPEITVRVVAEGGGYAVLVRDNGQGIPPEDQPRVFDRFYRTDHARSGHRPGLGLGLHISEQLARMLGANLTLTSEVGHGTEFRFWMPGSTVPPPRGRRGQDTTRLTWSTRS
jgi:PAS domain S-box-containing protein